jgi:hypothetical protein
MTRSAWRRFGTTPLAIGLELIERCRSRHSPRRPHRRAQQGERHGLRRAGSQCDGLQTDRRLGAAEKLARGG